MSLVRASGPPALPTSASQQTNKLVARDRALGSADKLVLFVDLHGTAVRIGSELQAGFPGFGGVIHVQRHQACRRKRQSIGQFWGVAPYAVGKVVPAAARGANHFVDCPEQREVFSGKRGLATALSASR